MGVVMLYKEGGIVTTKKLHACGGNKWIILGLGVDVKLKCVTCGRVIFVLRDRIDKMVKKYEEK